MLLYLNHYGPEDERRIHPIIQQRRKSTKKFNFNKSKINEQLDKTFKQMNSGKEIINQAWVGFENYIAKVSRFSKKDGESIFGSFLYIPEFLGDRKHLRKPLMMEGAYIVYLSRDSHKSDVDYFIVRKDGIDVKISVDKYMNQLLLDLPEIESIKKNEKKISPNYTRDCRICEWREYCRKIAKETNDLTLISGIGKRIKHRLSEIGIDDVISLANLEFNSIPIDIGSRSEREYIHLQAKSIVNKEEIIRERVKLPKSKVELFVDIEGSSHHNFIWLIGCLVRKDGELDYLSFLAESPKEERKMMQSFLSFLQEFNEEYALYHWSSAEPQYFRNLVKSHSLSSDGLRSLLRNSFDLFPIFKKKVILPLYTYTLKEVANWLGFHWFEPLSDGATSIVLFDKWYMNKDKKALDKVISYNSDDCKAMLIIKDYLTKKLSNK